MGDPACTQCIFWHEPDIGADKCCNFPWFDYTEDDVMKKVCATEDDWDGP